MKSLLNSKTAENLAKAFAGESQARSRYTYYGKIADKEGHKQIAAIFYETADNEMAHAKIFFDFLVQGLGKSTVKVDADYPVASGNTEQNLQYAAEGEKAEWGTIYPSFAKTAKDEGYPEIEFAFNQIITIETAHEKRYLDLKSSLANGTIYNRKEKVYWKCRNCGFIYFGTTAPTVCPACKYPQGYFEIMYNTQS
ncbi:rubrerythrin [Clostridium hydrogenum]|uniref:rubrerythrin n=1 Tax=Clostridium hydrogenum TaxID=2855764 RepID=UPI001F3FB7EE|nr:rubrerythrin family protein [Clostridium hydrogenum]